jgi:hypothetical protein
MRFAESDLTLRALAACDGAQVFVLVAREARIFVRERG